MKALLYEGPGRVLLKEVPVPKIGDAEALVAVEACGLCGTDLAKIFGGRLKPPVPLGHEVAGRVAKVGRRVRSFKPGDRVLVAHHVPCYECHYCLRGSLSMCREFKLTNLDPGGFSEFARVSERHLRHTTLKLPAGLDFQAASQAEPLACCVRNVKRLKLRHGDLAVLVGLGAIGLMTAQLLQSRGVTVLGLDLDPHRVRLALKAGIRHAAAAADGAEVLVRSLSDGRGADALVLTAGTHELAAQRLSWLRDGGTLNVFAGFHPESAMRLDLNQVYHRELTVTASYSAAPEDLREALGLIASGALDLGPYLHSAYPLERFDEAVRQVRGREVFKAILTPQKAAAGAAA